MKRLRTLSPIVHSLAVLWGCATWTLAAHTSPMLAQGLVQPQAQQAQQPYQAALPPAKSGAERLKLSIEEAVRMGLEASRFLHASQMKIDAADARVREIGAQMLPSLSFTGSYTRLSNIPQPRFNFDLGSMFNISRVSPQLLADPSVQRTFQAIGQATAPDPNAEATAGGFPVILDNFNFRATVQYAVFTGFRMEASKAASEFTAQATAQDFAKDKLETVFNIKQAYWMLYKAQQFKRLTEETVRQAEDHVRDVQNMVKLGMLTNNDLLRLQVQLSNAKVAVIEASNSVRMANVALNNLLGKPLQTEIEPTSTLNIDTYQPSMPPEYERTIEQALNARPDVAATELRVRAAEEGVRAAKGGWLPQVAVAANYLYANPNQRFVLDGAVWNGTWDASVQLQWTLWNWNVTGYQTAQAEAQVAQVQDMLAQLKDGIKVEVTQNYLAFTQTKEKLAVAKQTIEQANENYRITSEKFRKGTALTSDLTDAETLQLQAKVSYVAAIIDYEIAQARLAKTLGEAAAK